MQKALKFLTIGLATAALAACAKPQGDDRLREKAEIDAKGTQDQTDKRANEMEARLTRQQRFYQAVAGVFVGKMKTNSGTNYDVRFLLTPTIPVYEGNRTRSIDEITYDLTNLAFNIEEITTAPMPGGKQFSTGCIFSLIKPKIDSGSILASSQQCPVTYTMTVGRRRPAGKPQQAKESAVDITKKVLDGEIDSIDTLTIEMRSVHRAGIQTFDVKRVN